MNNSNEIPWYEKLAIVVDPFDFAVAQTAAIAQTTGSLSSAISTEINGISGGVSADVQDIPGSFGLPTSGTITTWLVLAAAIMFLFILAAGKVEAL